MNTIIPLPDGRALALTPAEAEKMVAWLATRLPCMRESDQSAALAIIHDLGCITAPEHAYDEWLDSSHGKA